MYYLVQLLWLTNLFKVVKNRYQKPPIIHKTKYEFEVLSDILNLTKLSPELAWNLIPVRYFLPQSHLKTEDSDLYYSNFFTQASK